MKADSRFFALKQGHLIRRQLQVRQQRLQRSLFNMVGMFPVEALQQLFQIQILFRKKLGYGFLSLGDVGVCFEGFLVGFHILGPLQSNLKS